MENYLGPLVLAATLAGAVWIVLAAWWLFSRKSLTALRKTALAFMCAGVIVPAALIPVWTWIDRHRSFSAIGKIQDIALVLWPTSIALMALDSPEPLHWNAIAFVYAFSILGNIGAYGAIGLIVGAVYTRLTRSARA